MEEWNPWPNCPCGAFELWNCIGNDTSSGTRVHHGGSWARSQGVSFASCRVSVLDKNNIRGAWSQDVFFSIPGGAFGPEVKFLGLVPQVISKWSAWLDLLVEALVRVNICYRPTGCYGSQVSLSPWLHSWRIQRHLTPQLIEPVDAATLPVSYKQFFFFGFETHVYMSFYRL